MNSFNFKYSVPNDNPDNSQFIAPNNLKSQEHLNIISNHKIIFKKNDFNCTKNNQFTTWLALSGENMEVVLQTKLLGTKIKKISQMKQQDSSP